MMMCPNCRARYDDDTLKFCLEDGTPLVAGPVTEAPTVAFGNVGTVLSPKGQTGASWGPGQTGGFSPPTQPPPARKSNTGLAVLLTALGMLVIFGIVAAGAWMYFKDRQGERQNSNSSLTSVSTANSATPNSKPNTRSTPSPAANSWSNTPPAVSDEEVKKEVAKTIYTWKSTAESHDLDSYMGNYAETVDYYLKKGASRAFVRDSKEKAFDTFDSISIDISNLSVTPGPAGDEASADFDKEWVFDGSRRSTGKVRQQLQLKRVHGEWLITAERDLKVYYSK